MRGVTLAGDLRIDRRQNIAAPASSPDVDPDSDPESEDDGSDLDEPDTPSPTQTAFPSGISSSALAVQPTQTATVDIGNIGTEISAPISILASDPAASGVTALPATSQDDQAQEQDITQVTEQQGLINRGGVIAMGTLIGLSTLITIGFVLWKCYRRRRNRMNRTSGIKPFFLGKDDSRSQEQQQQQKWQRRRSTLRSSTPSENGNAWGGGAGRPASQQSSDTLWREKQQAVGVGGGNHWAPQQKSRSGSLYSSQLKTGFWKKGGDGMPAAPGQARVSGPAPALSVAGKTEATSRSGATESTWNTWGVEQHHNKPKGNWVDKLRR